MKKISFLLILVAVSAFAFEWGIYGGPRCAVDFVNMNPIHDELTASDYDLPNLSRCQLGLGFPIYFRLGQFTIGGGDNRFWQSSKGDDWKAQFDHRIELAEFGFVIELDENRKVRPLIGIGDYDITMRLSEIGGGFTPNEDSERSSYRYDYSTPVISTGIAFSYLWRIHTSMLIGFEAKAIYVIPLERDRAWDERGGPNSVIVEDFFPHSPILSMGLLVGWDFVDWKVK